VIGACVESGSQRVTQYSGSPQVWRLNGTYLESEWEQQ